MCKIVMYDLKSLTLFINRFVYYFITSFILMIIIIFFFVWDMTPLILSSFSFKSRFFFVKKVKRHLFLFFVFFFHFYLFFRFTELNAKLCSLLVQGLFEENFQSSQLSMTKNSIRGNLFFCPHLLLKACSLQL